MDKTETEIKVMLETYAEHKVQRDLIDLDKRKLLEEVKVPDEVQAIVNAGTKQLSEVEDSFSPALKAIREEAEAQLAQIVVPEEIRAALAEIDRQRAEVRKTQGDKEAEIVAKVRTAKTEIQNRIATETNSIYDAIAQRKRDIEAEFAGKTEAVDANITALEKEIKAAVTAIGFTVDSEYYYAVYNKPKKTWSPQRLDAYTEKHPDIKECYTTGEPSVAIRRK